MSDKIQDRLRELVLYSHNTYTEDLCAAAADHIDALEARIATLESDERRRIAAMLMVAAAYSTRSACRYAVAALEVATDIQQRLDTEVKP